MEMPGYDEIENAIRSVLARGFPGYFEDTIAACARAVVAIMPQQQSSNDPNTGETLP